MLDSLHTSQSVPILSCYEVVGPLGRGATGFVFKIKERKRPGKFYALKVIDKNYEKFDKIKYRVMNEIEIQSKLDHENIVKLYNTQEDKDNYFIYIEFCGGGELYNYLKSRGKFTESEVRNYGFQLAKALKYLHDNNVIHRDLKLGNILLGEGNTLKICDFGLAARLTDNKPERNTLCGTPNYVSPEVVNEEPYGYKADCWAYGCILYTMVTGTPPFEGKDVKDTLKKVKKGTFDLPKNISKNLLDLIVNLINWEPAERYDMAKVLNHPFFHEIPSTPSYQIQNQSFENDIVNSSMSFGEGLQGRKSESALVIKENFSVLNSHQTPQGGKTVVKTVRSDSRTPHERKLPPARRGSVGSANNSASKENKENHEYLANFAVPPNAFKRDPTRAPTGKHSRNNSLEKLEKIIEKNENHPTPQIIKAKPKEIIQIQMKDTSEKDYYRKDNSGVLNTFGDELSSRVLDQTLNTTTTTLNTTSRSHFSTNLSTCRGTETLASFYTTTESDYASNNSTKPVPNPEPKDKKLLPLNTHGLKPQKFNTKNGIIEIREDGWLIIETTSKRVISIAPNGLRVYMRKNYPVKSEKQFDLIKLPVRYHKFYQYGAQVLEVIRSKLPKVKLEDKDGKYYLLHGKNFPNFEARFKDGSKLTHTVSTELIRLDTGLGNIYEINIRNDIDQLDPDTKMLVTKSLEKLNECLYIDRQSEQN